MATTATLKRIATRCSSRGRFLCLFLFLVAVIIWTMDFTTRGSYIYNSLKYKTILLDNSINQTFHETSRQSPSINIWKNQTVFLHPDVKVVPSTLPETFVLPYQDCVPLPKSPKAGVVICIYPVEDDIFISKVLKSGKLHEETLVLQVGEYLKRFPEMVFVDIGSNIGVYTLFAAALGHKVLAVDMLPRNVQRIQMAARISGLGSEVTIVNNALYFDYRVINVEIEQENVGGTELEIPYRTNDSENVDVHTITMDDLIPLLEGATAFMKMDIENSEHYALRGAKKFFQKVNVKVVQMEFLHTQNRNISLEIWNFMNSAGYVLSRSINKYTSVDVNHLVGDFYFLKKTWYHKLIDFLF